MAEAEKLEKEGKTEESDMAFQQAVDAEEMAMFTKVEVVNPKGAGVSGEVYGRTAGHRRTGRGQHHRQRRGTQDTGKIRIIRT